VGSLQRPARYLPGCGHVNSPSFAKSTLDGCSFVPRTLFKPAVRLAAYTHCPSFTPFQGCQHPCRPHRRFYPSPPGLDASALLSPRGHSQRLLFAFLRFVLHGSTFLPRLRSTAVTPLHRSYGGSDSWTPHRRLVADRRQVSLLISRHLHVVPLPITHARPVVASAPLARRASLRSGLHRWRAGSSRAPAESYSLALRTDVSPPDALHPASRRRSFFRFQTQGHGPAGTCTP
jgi:hypothetical protein